MRLLILFIVVVIVFGYPSLQKRDTIEIYLVEDVSNDFTIDLEDCCRNCFDFYNAKRAPTPIISAPDIEYFSWKEQRIQLKETGLDKISTLRIYMHGMPTVLLVNGKPVYGLWFWSYYSSVACDQVCAFPQHDFRIRFGFPEKYKKGIDPRFNEELKNALTNLHLLQ